MVTATMVAIMEATAVATAAVVPEEAGVMAAEAATK
jgi:hypothetical protein